MKWICNAQYPEDRLEEIGGMSRQEYRDWFNSLIIGEPKVPPGQKGTVAELKRMKLVGMYEPGTIDRILNNQLYDIKTVPHNKVR